MTRDDSSPRTKRPRKPRQAGAVKPLLSHETVLVPLSETDALLALSAGAVMMGVRGAEDGGRLIECWRGSVPPSAVQRVTTGDAVGGIIVLKVSAGESELIQRDGRLLLTLPVSVSRVKGASVSSADYLRLLVARVDEFPDVVLDAVPLAHDPVAFASREEDLFGSAQAEGRDALDEVPEHEEVRLGDKAAGAVAGLIIGLTAAPGFSSSELDVAWSSVEAAGSSTGAEFILLVGNALATEPADATTRLFIAGLVDRLRTLGTATGFDPEELLSEVVEGVGQVNGPDGMDVLERFAAVARTLLKLQPGVPRDMLLDGGSVMLRGALAFLQSPDVEKIEAAVRKGSRVGPRVGTFALTLAGYYTGTTALSRHHKASPIERLLSLGDVIEAAGKGGPLKVTSQVELDASGISTWQATLAGRRVASLEMPLPKPLEVVARVSKHQGWPASIRDGMITLIVHAAPAVHTITASVTNRGPFEPSSQYVSLSLGRVITASRLGAAAQACVHVAGSHAVMASLVEEEGRLEVQLTLYLHGPNILEEHVRDAVGRLLQAVRGMDSRSPQRSKNRKRPATQLAESPVAADQGDSILR